MGDDAKILSRDPAEENRSEISPAEMDRIIYEASYSGPIPPPNLLRQFDDIVPGTAGRIIRNSFDQTNHRMSLEKSVVAANIAARREAMRLGAALGFVALMAGTYLGSTGHTTAAVSMIGLVGGGLATSFLGTIYKQRSEMRDKREDAEHIDPKSRLHTAPPDRE